VIKGYTVTAGPPSPPRRLSLLPPVPAVSTFPEFPDSSRLPHPDASVGCQVAPLRGGVLLRLAPPSPPLHLSLLPRDTPQHHLGPGKFSLATGRSCYAPLGATSDRGSSLRLPGTHVSPFSTGPALPAGSPVSSHLSDSDPTPPLSCRRGAAMTRHTSRLAALAPDLQSPSASTKAWSALQSEQGLYQRQLAALGGLRGGAGGAKNPHG